MSKPDELNQQPTEFEEIPLGWNACLYCGEAIEAPALYCCEEHEEGRSMR